MTARPGIAMVVALFLIGVLMGAGFGYLRQSFATTGEDSLAGTFRSEGWEFYHNGDYDRAAKTFERYLEDNPENVPALLGLAEAAYRIGDYERTAIAVERLRWLHRDVGERAPLVLNLLGASYYQMGDLENAAAAFSEALNTTETATAQALIGLSVVHHELDRIELAEQFARDAEAALDRLGADLGDSLSLSEFSRCMAGRNFSPSEMRVCTGRI